MRLKINHLYSRNLNIYGDLGNIIALIHLGSRLGISTKTVNTEIGDNKPQPADIYFIGGGQDRDQILVYRDLLRHKKFLEEEVNAGKLFLLVCGGYQLFGRFFVDGEGNLIEGLGILDMETRAQDTKVTSRCIGNIVVSMDKKFVDYWEVNTSFSPYLVGFENHGGQTRLQLSPSLQSIGKVVVGFGNNSVDKVEGCWYKNIIGTYLHGSLLPKNPHLAEAIIKKALMNKYGSQKWGLVNYSMEKTAHQAVLVMLGIEN